MPEIIISRSVGVRNDICRAPAHVEPAGRNFLLKLKMANENIRTEDDLLSDLQKRAVDKVTRSRGGLVWWKVGEGKTRIAYLYSTTSG